MTERLNKLIENIKEFWEKYTPKQKTIIISVVGTIILAIVVLILVTGRTKYEELIVVDTPKDASKIIEILEGDDIGYRIDADNVTISVDVKRYSDAALLIASNDMPSYGLSLDTLLGNSLSTTNSDRNLKLNLYMQDQVKKYLTTMNGVDSAELYYIPVDNTTSILSAIQETSASVLLNVNDDFEPKTAETIAEVVASVIGNETTNKIKVADQFGNLLYGGERDLYSGSASSNEDYKERLRNTFINNLYMGLLKNGYDDAEIMPNLVFNMDKISELFTEYLPTEGEEQGVYKRYYSYKSENAGYNSGVPGTSSNDDTDYLMEDDSSNTGSQNVQEIDYLPNEKVTNIEFEIGAVIPEESSMSIVLRRVVEYKEEELELEGLLDDMTFEEYILENDEGIKSDVDQEIFSMVSLATGIAENNIHIMAYDNPVFIPKAEVARSWTSYLQIFLAILIFALLIFVIFRVTVPVEVTEVDSEVSVEDLLATTRESEQQIEDIEFSESSEVRRMIEKFVDEKPEAVAQLLRNWFNQDWE